MPEQQRRRVRYQRTTTSSLSTLGLRRGLGYAPCYPGIRLGSRPLVAAIIHLTGCVANKRKYGHSRNDALDAKTFPLNTRGQEGRSSFD
jgi:hypothetical protein